MYRGIFLFFIVLCFNNAYAVDVVKIDKNTGYHNYSSEELKRRVWQLEQAVVQLQQQVFNLSVSSSNSDTWACTLTVMSDKFIATGGSKAVAKARAIEKCTKERSSSFLCKDPVCEQ